MNNFTLKEAILCTVCLAALILTAPLAVGNARNNAKLIGCVNKLRMIGAAELTYAADNKSELAMGEKNYIRDGGAARAATYSMGTPPMMLIRHKYLKTDNPADSIAVKRERFFHCPEDEVNFVNSPITGWGKPVPAISYLYCWFATQKCLRSHSFPCKTRDDQDDNYGLRSNVDRDDPERFIFADLVKNTSRAWSGQPKEKARANHNGCFNTLYIGGHVSTKNINAKQEEWLLGGSHRFALLADNVR